MLPVNDQWQERRLFEMCPACLGRGRDRYGECSRCEGSGLVEAEEDNDG